MSKSISIIKQIPITSIAGFQIGQAEDGENGTGLTTIICKEGATAGMQNSGGAPATRESDLLKPENSVEKIHAVVLSGGSAFGLQGAEGVMDYLSKENIGFSLGEFAVPIVVGASLFDLSVGNPSIFPDAAMGYKAAKESENSNFKPGNHGAGTGASVFKLAGFEHAIKSGIGSYALECGELQVGAIAAVNACGSIYDREKGEYIAGQNPIEFMSLAIEESLRQGEQARSNTTIGCVITNARLSKAECKRVAIMGQDGLARVIIPAHTSNDGDTLYVMANGKVETQVDLVGMLAAECVEKAILNGVRSAKEAYGLKAAGNTEEQEQKQEQ